MFREPPKEGTTPKNEPSRSSNDNQPEVELLRKRLWTGLSIWIKMPTSEGEYNTKSKDKDFPQPETAKTSAVAAVRELDQESQMTCDVLCSLSSMVPVRNQHQQESSSISEGSHEPKKRSAGKSSCPKQLQ